MMTAAEMDSYRRADRKEQGVTVSTLITAGISNAGRAGDPAAHRLIDEAALDIGTVNIVVVTDAVLSESALVEALMTVTEAKAAAFQNLGIRSIATGACATGTGTDAVAVAAGFGPRSVRFCGKHVLFGEMLAETTIRAISDSLGN
jgi:adenosylcobinamide amidohydrolase